MNARLMRAGLACMAVIAVIAAPAAAAQAAPTITAPLHKAHGRAIAGQYIVVLKAGSDGAAVARRHKVPTQQVYSTVLDGFSARLNAKQLKAVREDSSVAYVEPDGIATINDKPAPGPSKLSAPGTKGSRPHALEDVSGQSVQTGATWGLDRVDQRARPLNGKYNYTSLGTGVTAYIIDTGIYTAHTDFGGRATGGFTAISDGNGTNDCHGHGTHVAGTIGGATYGVAKGVSLVAVRVLDCSGSGAWSGVIAGIDYVTYNHSGPSVANMSLGGGFIQAVNDAVTNSISQGVTYAIAAGNSNDNACSYSPSSTPLALTVAATDNTDTRASFSNFGSCTDLFAPGVDITSDWNTSTTATNTISGTSMASPHVAGLVALFLQANPYATQAVVNSVFKVNSAYGLVTNPGAGSQNLIARKFNGSISGTGASSYTPDGSYWHQNGSGYIRAWLQGTSGTDPDLYLQKFDGTNWVTVAGSASVTPQERIAYNAGPGDYTLRAYGFSGGGTYDTWTTRPL